MYQSKVSVKYSEENSVFMEVSKNSEVAYYCMFCKSRYTRKCPPGGEFNKGLQQCGET